MKKILITGAGSYVGTSVEKYLMQWPEAYCVDTVDMIGEDRIKDILQQRIAEASYNPDYECTQENVMRYWLRLPLFVLAFAALSTITLEFIDKDKR